MSKRASTRRASKALAVSLRTVPNLQTVGQGKEPVAASSPRSVVSSRPAFYSPVSNPWLKGKVEELYRRLDRDLVWPLPAQPQAPLSRPWRSRGRS